MTTNHYYSERGNAILFHVRRFTVYMKFGGWRQSKPSKYRDFLARIVEKVAVYWFTQEQILNKIEAFTENVYSQWLFTSGLQQGIGNSIGSPVFKKMSSWLKSHAQICKVDVDNVMRNRHNVVLGKFQSYTIAHGRGRGCKLKVRV